MLSWAETFPPHTTGFRIQNSDLPYLVTMPQPLLMSYQKTTIAPGHITFDSATQCYTITFKGDTFVYTVATEPEHLIEPDLSIVINELLPRDIKDEYKSCHVLDRKQTPQGTVFEVIEKRKESELRWLEFITAWDPTHIAKYLATCISLPHLHGVDKTIHADINDTIRCAYIKAFTYAVTPNQMRDITGHVLSGANWSHYIRDRLPSSAIADFLIKERIGCWKWVPKDVIKLICSKLTPEFYGAV